MKTLQHLALLLMMFLAVSACRSAGPTPATREEGVATVTVSTTTALDGDLFLCPPPCEELEEFIEGAVLTVAEAQAVVAEVTPPAAAERVPGAVLKLVAKRAKVVKAIAKGQVRRVSEDTWTTVATSASTPPVTPLKTTQPLLTIQPNATAAVGATATPSEGKATAILALGLLAALAGVSAWFKFFR